MPLTRKRATIWSCSDGKEFTTLSEAAAHEQRVQFNILCDDIGFGRGGEWGPDMIANAIWEDRQRFMNIFRLSETAMKRSAKPANVEVGDGK